MMLSFIIINKFGNEAWSWILSVVFSELQALSRRSSPSCKDKAPARRHLPHTQGNASQLCFICTSFLAFPLPGFLLLLIPCYCWSARRGTWRQHSMAGQMAEGHGEESQRGVMGTLRVTGSMELSEEGGNKKYRQEEKAVSVSWATSKCRAVFWCCIIYQVLSFNQSLLSLSHFL